MILPTDLHNEYEYKAKPITCRVCGHRWCVASDWDEGVQPPLHAGVVYDRGANWSEDCNILFLEVFPETIRTRISDHEEVWLDYSL